jgi:hypothetical protein
MATVLTPTREQWEQLREIGVLDDQAVVLVHPDVAFELEERGIQVPQWSNYDFGGEADTWLDVVTVSQHMFVDGLLEAAGFDPYEEEDGD